MKMLQEHPTIEEKAPDFESGLYFICFFYSLGTADSSVLERVQDRNI